ncbi:MAG TPA: bacterioferritin [Geminicoccaceae bacterium]|nr:bacterioferritin [Geminicoccaceae bacterium]
MQGDPQVLALLNEQLQNELTAVNQFLAHARLLEDWGLVAMSKHEHEESLEEREHADLLIQRILLLGGTPDLQTLGQLQIGQDVKGVLEGDLAIEIHAEETLARGIRTAEQIGDYVSRDLFTKILEDEERHAHHLRRQLQLIDRIGLQNYIQSQI